MIGISINTNGIVGDNKKGWIRELVDRNSPLFVGIQESKLLSCDKNVIRSLWPRNYINFAVSNSVGASGGIITIWDSRTFTMEQNFIDRFFVGVVGSWVGSCNKIGLLNVYAPQCSSLKEILWSSIESLINSVNVTWVVFGDFNVVRSQDERSGCSFDSGEAGVFNDFLSRTGLFGLPLWGRRAFTEIRNSGVFGEALVTATWAEPTLAITPDNLLKNKLKKLRMAIKSWTLDRYSAQNKDRDTLSKNLLDWDVKAENGLINEVDVIKREEWLMDLNRIDQLLRDDLKHKCRLKWAVEGDENTKFFHSTLNVKFANFSIKGILVNGNWEDSPVAIKNAAIEHFSSHFKESDINRPPFLAICSASCLMLMQAT
ncbi:RNA-directed DNA polymerase, eukaryota [Tanacetum coccineum]|uniref:RNA-directed DNA polymerase, eukaryota n=1 Tax=Tanacetum coccineum TaxID=301880 RepID=A0ABQ5BVL9_9ASTR